MKNQDNRPQDAAELRRRAEEIARGKAAQSPENLEALSPEQTRRMLHELRVHQIELEMQNEELRRAQVELDGARARYFDLYDLAPVGYCTISEKGLVLEPNLTVATLLGAARSMLVHRPISRFILPEDQNIYYQHRKQLLETDEPQAFELRMVKMDGTAFWGQLAATAAQDEGGEPVLRVVIGDITERKQAEEQLRQANERLVEADRRKNEFLAMLAHELRNPLAPVRNAVQVLRLAGDREDIRQRQQDIIDRQVTHMARLLDDLLDVARITRGKIDLQRLALDMTAVLAHAVETTTPLIEARRHTLHVTMPPATLRVEGDIDRLSQVGGNLLTNAAKYTPEGGQIWLSADREGEEAVVRVRDNGTGIASELLPHIFDLFTQADRTLGRSQGGLGIGLTMVRNLVEMHGGTVEARSAGVGQGSEFIVRLPALPEARLEQDQSAPMPAPAAGGGSRRILIVDDVVDTATSLAELLGLWGHEVQVAHDGLAALCSARVFHPEVVLLDIGLPGMDGYTAARHLRAEQGPAGMLIVALTGYGQTQDLESTCAAGFDHHLVKPVDLEALRGLFDRAPA